MTPKVSTLICADKFNDYFKQAIDSCLNQTFTDFEIILVVNGVSIEEKSNFINFLKRFERVHLYFTDVHCLTYNLNFGLNKCNGFYIARMDADDISYPERLEKQIFFMDNNTNIGICGSWFEFIDENNKKIRDIRLPVTDMEIRRSLYWSNPICHPSVMIKKDILKKVCGYMGGLYAQDYDLWLRIALDKSVKFYNIPEALIGYRMVSIGKARGSRLSYANSAGYHLRNFLLTFNPLWLFGSFLYIFKLFVNCKSKI